MEELKGFTFEPGVSLAIPKANSTAGPSAVVPVSSKLSTISNKRLTHLVAGRVDP